jgi:FkbM family methyltransferase
MNSAVGGHNGRRFIALENVPAGQRRLLADGKENAPPGVEVSCHTLESILDQYDLRSVDLAKVDIEGSEFEVLLATPPSALCRIARMDIEIHKNVTAQERRPMNSSRT